MNRFQCFVLAATILGGLAVSPSLRAQAKPGDARVLSVRIDANDDGVSNLVNSYVSRELRSLRDVTINEAPQPTFVIHCGCLPLMTNGVKLGYVVSLVITSNLKPMEYIAQYKDLLNVLDASPEARIYAVKTFLTMKCRLTQQFEDQILFTCPVDDLKEQCESFVATFDTKYLNPLREKHD